MWELQRALGLPKAGWCHFCFRAASVTNQDKNSQTSGWLIAHFSTKTMFWLGYRAGGKEEGGREGSWETEGSDGWSKQDGGRRRSRKSRPRAAKQCRHSLQFPCVCLFWLNKPDRFIHHLLPLSCYFPFLADGCAETWRCRWRREADTWSARYMEQILHCYTGSLSCSVLSVLGLKHWGQAKLESVFTECLYACVCITECVFMCVCPIKTITLGCLTQV